MYISNFSKKKVVDYLTSYGKILFIFRHGLGDIVNFIPLVEELKVQYPKYQFYFGIEKSRNLNFYPHFFQIDSNFRSIMSQFTHIFRINYFEPENGMCKPYVCNEKEIGLDYFTWKPYNLKIEKIPIKKRAGIHFFGNTKQGSKSLDEETAEIIWNELIISGFEPFEITNNSFNFYTDLGKNFIKKSSTLRFSNPKLETMIFEISQCETFLGIESGLIYLAGTILGFENCVGLERNYLFEKYLPERISIIDVKNYKKGNVIKKLKAISYEKIGSSTISI